MEDRKDDQIAPENWEQRTEASPTTREEANEKLGKSFSFNLNVDAPPFVPSFATFVAPTDPVNQDKAQDSPQDSDKKMDKTSPGIIQFLFLTVKYNLKLIK